MPIKRTARMSTKGGLSRKSIKMTARMGPGSSSSLAPVPVHHIPSTLRKPSQYIIPKNKKGKTARLNR